VIANGRRERKRRLRNTHVILDEVKEGSIVKGYAREA
jgi:hypothetical protein